MSLKSSEINNCSWNISTVLISSFWTSSCWQICFPTIIRPIIFLWKLILKIILYFSRIKLLRFLLVVLSETVEKDGFRSSKLRTQWENVSLVQYQSNSCSSKWFQMKSQQVLFFVILFSPLIGMQNFSHPVVTHVLRADLQELLCRCYSKSITNLFFPWDILIWKWVLSPFRDSNRDFQHGSNFRVSLNPSFWLWWLVTSWKSVFTSSSPNLWVPLDPSFRCDAPSSLGRHNLRRNHCIVWDLQCPSSWNTVQFLKHSEILHPYRI